MPIHVGGHSRVAAERAGRLGDGFFPAKGDLAELIDVMRQSAADAGRDASAIEVTAGDAGVFGSDPVAAVEELAAQGVDRIAVPAFLHLRDTAESLAAFGETGHRPHRRPLSRATAGGVCRPRRRSVSGTLRPSDRSTAGPARRIGP